MDDYRYERNAKWRGKTEDDDLNSKYPMWKATENLRTEVWRLGEDIACEHLERAGYSIIERNWTAWAAEIDVIARDPDGALWFFEVKFRRTSRSGFAAESFTTKKRHAFFRAVSLYCKKSWLDFDDVRAGLIAVDQTDVGYRVVRYSNLAPIG